MSSSLSARDSQLGAGLLLLAIGIGLVEVRLNATWSKGVLFVVVLVAFVALLALALRSRTGLAEDAEEDGNPSALTSLVCALAFAYGVATVYRFGTILEPHGTLRHAGTLTWMLALITAIGSVLGNLRRSATVIFATLISFSALTFATFDWLFDFGRDQSSYRYVAIGLVVIYILGGLSIRLWPRLASVLYVAAGLLLLLMVMTMFGLNRGHLVLLPMVFIGVYPKAPFGWLAVILLGGFVLAAVSAMRKDPGPGYAAAAVLVYWVTIAAAPLSNISIVGWPLALLIIGGLVLAFAVTDTRNNRFTLTGHPEMLAAGSLIVGIGVLITVERMAFLWSNGVTLAIAAVATALFALFALAQPDEGNEPAGTTSLLTVIALGATALLFVRLARLHAVLPLGQSGTWTWVMGATAAVAAGLALVRRSAGVALAAMLFAASAAVGGGIWLFHADHHSISYPWIFTGLTVLYVVLAVLTRAMWLRLATVATAAAGIALISAFVVFQSPSLLFGDVPLIKGAPSPAWMVGAVVVTIALAGAAALLHRAASPGYAAAALATSAVLLDRLRLPGHAASVLLWPLIVLVFGAGLVVVAALWGRHGSGSAAAAEA